MKVKLLKKLRKKAKKKIKLYKTGEYIYKITSPYSYMADSYFRGNLTAATIHTLANRRSYILTVVSRMRRKKEQKYPILINI